MSKNSMEDMIKIKIIKKDMAPKRVKDEYLNLKSTSPVNNSKNIKGSKTGPIYILWSIAFISVVFLFFAFSYMFSGADISLTPKIEDLIINESLSANKDSNSSPISFDLVVISGEESQKVEVKEKTSLEVKARGRILFFNAFSTSPQMLSIDTRLEGSNGKIYKTEKKVVVPGLSKDGKPGSIEVGIYGAVAGEEYNSKPLDFKILGFKGTPKYSKIYARSKGDITGGTKGNFYSIPVAEKEKALSDLKESLRIKLLKKASEQIPKGFVLFDDAVFLNTNNEMVTSFSKESSVPISLKGTLYGFLFDEKKLTKKIVEDTIKDYDGSDVYIANIKNLSFSLVNKENISFSDVKNINFTLKGDGKMVWNFDANKFAGELLDQKKKDFNLILSKYPNVVSANLVLKPFWRMSFPSKLKDIRILVNYPK